MWQIMKSSMQPMPSQIVPLVNVWNAPCQIAARLEKSIVPQPFHAFVQNRIPHRSQHDHQNQEKIRLRFQVGRGSELIHIGR